MLYKRLLPSLNRIYGPLISLSSGTAQFGAEAHLQKHFPLEKGAHLIFYLTVW